ncbi:SDR family oxidoreductase [Psychromonas ossibalaenae]|uniref:SDR family oxidoreductase n=1 Tax=Psychromonas ossibalaenae TaxID=444922 RepID=UPI000371550F|nr:SDR family oxidoreductase [Psychromonas ossibalaenae]
MSKTLLITGANRGIGLALAALFKKNGYQVIALCRSESEEIKETADRLICGIDFTCQADLDRVYQQLQKVKVDVLINNAGLLQDDVLGSIEIDSLRRQMEINAYAPLMVSEKLLPCLSKGGKIINITSRMGSIADNDSGGRYGYRASKAALNAFTKSLAVDLKEQGIAAAVIHPGWVKTRMVGFNGLISAEESAQGMFTLIESLNMTSSGSFWHSSGEELPW